MDKDILRTCSVVGDAAPRAADANADAVRDSVLRDPAHGVTPNGTPGCKNAGSKVRAAPGTTRNNPAAHTADTQNLSIPALPVDPRATPIRQLTLQS
jgi:hypothetical protein